MRAPLIGAFVIVLCDRGMARAGMFELLDWSCNDPAKHQEKGEQEALAICDMTAGEKKACDVTEGEPFACFGPRTYKGTETCEYNDLNITINASTQQVLGWKIEGEIEVEAGYKVTFEGEECRPEIKPDGEDRGTGTFVRRGGTAKLVAEFSASGEGYITFLGGKIFGKKFTKECKGEAAPKGHILDKKSGCSASCAAAVPGAFAVACTDTAIEGDWTPVVTEATPVAN